MARQEGYDVIWQAIIFIICAVILLMDFHSRYYPTPPTPGITQVRNNPMWCNGVMIFVAVVIVINWLRSK
jgi:hypothetical protein